MAEEKKSFVLYSDLLSVVEKLVKKDREEKTNYAGELFLHILEYVNDKEPIPIDFIIEMAFEPIKLQLKRDLKKWEVSKEDKVKNGIIGNLKRWQPDLYKQLNNDEITLEEAQEIAKHRKASPSDNINRPPSQDIANIAVNVNDNVSVNVNDNVIKEKVNKKGVPPSFDSFLNHAKEKAKEKKINLDEVKVKNKFETWLENGWKDLNEKPIINWKIKITSNLPYWQKTGNDAPLTYEELNAHKRNVIF